MKTPLFAALVCLPIYATATSQKPDTPANVNASDDIEVITVNSQRIVKPLLEVASNLTLVDSDTIDKLHLTDLSELMKIVPNVAMQSLMGDYDYIQMRGMPRNLEQATVSVYIDGVPYSSLYGLNLSLLNIESVEVLRGPQANLFGKNTRDGVIAISTKKISDETNAKVTLGAGNFSQKSAELQVSTPLIEDILAANFSGKTLKRDGVVENTYLGDEIDEVDEQIARASLAWQVNDNVLTSLTFNHLKKRNGSYPYVDGNLSLERGDKLAASLDTDNSLHQDINNISFTLNWLINKQTSFDSITSWDNTDTFGRFDADLGELPYGHYDTWIKEEELYQEFRLASTPEQGQFDYLLGLSFNKSEDNNRNEWLLGLNSIKGKISKNSYVAYGDITWRLPQNWQVQTGLRWVNEDIQLDSTFANPYIPLPSMITQGTTEQKDNQLLGKLALSKMLTEQQNIYLSWGQGYLSGGASWIAETMDNQANRQGYGVIYQPELSSTIELGYKAQLFSGRTHLDIAIFDATIDDYQHASIDAMGISRIKSIKEVQSQGIEASLKTRLADTLDWLIGFGFNDSKVTKIDGFSGATVTEGKRIPYAPKYNLHSHLSYHKELNNNWLLNSNISWQRFGSTYFDFSGTEPQDAYNVFDANVTLNFKDNWQLKLWGKNLTDERYKIYQIYFSSGQLASYGMPRQFGLDLSWTY